MKSMHVPPGGYGPLDELHPPQKIKGEKPTPQVVKIIFRIIALPFIAVIFLINMIRAFIQYMFQFIVYGGEHIAYNTKFNPDTIASLLEKQQKNNKMPFQDRVDQLKKDRSKLKGE